MLGRKIEGSEFFPLSPNRVIAARKNPLWDDKIAEWAGNRANGSGPTSTITSGCGFASSRGLFGASDVSQLVNIFTEFLVTRWNLTNFHKACTFHVRRRRRVDGKWIYERSMKSFRWKGETWRQGSCAVISGLSQSDPFGLKQESWEGEISWLTGFFYTSCCNSTASNGVDN